MENSIYIGLSRQLTLQSGMNFISNNIANMNTPGYRSQQPLFEEYIADPTGARDGISQVYLRGQYDITTAGPITLTGNEFDLAVNGPGFFGIDKNGEVLYSRAGNFSLNLNREVVTPNGHLLLSQGNAPISIPIDSTQVKINPDGSMFDQLGRQLGQVGVFEFEDLQQLSPRGDGLYESVIAPTVGLNSLIQQGAVEGSNVNPIKEMTAMIDISRKFTSNQRMLQQEHERQRNMIQRIGRSQQ